MKITRGELLKRSALAAAALAGWRAFDISPARASTIGYGPLGQPDANGLRLPAGFHGRLLAKSGEPVLNTSYIWPGQPDGSGTFSRTNGGWVLAVNSELNGSSGGASAIRFGYIGYSQK